MPQAFASDWGPYEIENTWFMHNPDWASAVSLGDFPVLSSDHPFQFEPYLYEGYSEAARKLYRSRDLSMKLARLGAGGPKFSGYPGAIKITLTFPATPRSLYPEPLITSGSPGKGDVIFIEYAEAEHDNSLLKIGHDDWGAGAVRSEPFRIDRSLAHTVVISMGSLYSPTE